MKTRRYSETRIFQILQEVDAGCPVVDAARKHGVSPATIHRWKTRYGRMNLSELRRLNALEKENSRLSDLPSYHGTGACSSELHCRGGGSHGILSFSMNSDSCSATTISVVSFILRTL